MDPVTEWVIRYRGVTPADIDEGDREFIVEHITDQAMPGLRMGDGPTVFSGEFAVAANEDYRSVMAFLDDLSILEGMFEGLTVFITDSLKLIARDSDGAWAVSLDGAGEAPDPGDDLELDEGPVSLADAVMGIEPEFLPFEDHWGDIPLHDPEPVAAEARVTSGRWSVDDVAVVRRRAVQEDGEVVRVSCRLTMHSAEVAHIVDADVALLDSEGKVVAAEVINVGHDVHSVGELWLEVPVDGELARRVTAIAVGLDAYYRTTATLARWRAGGGVTLVQTPGLTATCDVYRTGFGVDSLDACGWVENNGRAYLADVSLSFSVRDGAGDFLSDDLDELVMLGPGDRRAYRLCAPLEHEPKTGLLRAQVTERVRDPLMHVRLSGK